ncbi:hypothetical protein B0H11DRAFT_1911183 [Mycena galericulata]|nr:hypothetical protein B0H11DRAFT_1911183 [Mycena galericulata]
MSKPSPLFSSGACLALPLCCSIVCWYSSGAWYPVFAYFSFAIASSGTCRLGLHRPPMIIRAGASLRVVTATHLFVPPIRLRFLFLVAGSIGECMIGYVPSMDLLLWRLIVHWSVLYKPVGTTSGSFASAARRSLDSLDAPAAGVLSSPTLSPLSPLTPLPSSPPSLIVPPPSSLPSSPRPLCFGPEGLPIFAGLWPNAPSLAVELLKRSLFSSVDMPVPSDLLSFAERCKALLRDYPRFSGWVASVALPCDQCSNVPDIAARHGGCTVLPLACVCSPCKSRKVKCPYQYSYLFDETKSHFFSSRLDFDNAIALTKTRRSRPALIAQQPEAAPTLSPISSSSSALVPSATPSLPFVSSVDVLVCDERAPPVSFALPEPGPPVAPSSDVLMSSVDPPSFSLQSSAGAPSLDDGPSFSDLSARGAASLHVESGLILGPVTSSFTKDRLSGFDADALKDLVLSLASRLESNSASGRPRDVHAPNVPTSPTAPREVLDRCVDLVSAYHYQMLVAAQVARHRMRCPLDPGVDTAVHAALVLDTLIDDLQKSDIGASPRLSHHRRYLYIFLLSTLIQSPLSTISAAFVMLALGSFHLPLVAFINLLPWDVLCFLLEYCCGPYFRNPTLFTARRMVFSNVCRLWTRIIRTYSVFWSSMRVNRTQTLRHIDYMLARNRSNPFHLLVDFRPAPYHDDQYHDPPLPAIINRLLPHFVHLLSLVVYTGDTDILHVMRFNRELLHMPALTSLLIRTNRSSDYLTSVSLFPSLSTSLRTIVLSVLPFDFSTLPVLPNLYCLVLRDFSPSDYPTLSVFMSLLLSAPHVRDLSLDRFGLRGDLSDNGPLHLIPDLEVLHLALHSSTSIVNFLSRLSLPSLETLAVSFTSTYDSSVLLHCPALLGRPSIVHFDGCAPPLSSLIDIIRHLSSVREFHAPYVGLPFFRALQFVLDEFSALPAPRPVPLPELRHLGLGNMTIPEAISSLAVRPHLSSGFTIFTFWFSVVIEIERLPYLTALMPDMRLQIAYPVAARHFSRVGLRHMSIQPANSSTRLCLPPELVRLVFDFVLSDLDAPDAASLRRKISSHTVPAYWQSLFITLSVPAEAVELALRLSASLLLDVNVLFVSSDFPPCLPDSLSLSTMVQQRLEPLHAASHRIRSLTFDSDCGQALHAAQSVFSTLHAPALRKLALRYHFSNCADYIPSSGYVWFDAFPDMNVDTSLNLSCLSDVELRTVSIPSSLLVSSTLTRLHLYNSMDDSFLSFAAFRVILQHCNQLYDIALVNVACASVNDSHLDPGPPMMSLSVRRFHVRILHHRSLGILYPCLVFPGLLHLTVELDATADFGDIMAGPAINYAHVDELCIVSHYSDVGDIGELCSLFPSLRLLDLSRSPRGLSAVLRHFNSSSGHSAFVGLHSLHLGYESLVDVKQFALLSGALEFSDGSHITLRNVHLVSPYFDSLRNTYHQFSSLDRLDLAWLCAHIVNVSVPLTPPVVRPRRLMLEC